MAEPSCIKLLLEIPAVDIAALPGNGLAVLHIQRGTPHLSARLHFLFSSKAQLRKCHLDDVHRVSIHGTGHPLHFSESDEPSMRSGHGMSVRLEIAVLRACFSPPAFSGLTHLSRPFVSFCNGECNLRDRCYLSPSRLGCGEWHPKCT